MSSRTRTIVFRTVPVIFIIVLLAFAMRYTALIMFERKALPGKTTIDKEPAVPYQRLKIKSGDHQLDAFWVPAVDSSNASAILIFHGIGETIPLWVHVQELLHDHQVSSLIFDYAGDGKSSGSASISTLNNDGLAAYDQLRRKVTSHTKIYFLGFSMGSGMAMQAAVKALPVPAGIILCEPWSSLQAAAAATGTPKIFAYALPDYWNNIENASRINCPILIIHSDSDRVFSLAMSQAIYQKASVDRHIVIVHGFSHTGLYKKANMNYWSPVVNFVGGK